MSLSNTARLAGFMYLLLVLTGIFNLAYVPSQLIVWGDSATTVRNIIDSEFLFRLGIVAGILSYIFFLVLPFILYDLLKSVHQKCALFMVVLAAFSVPISIFNMINKIDVLTLLQGFDLLDGIEAQLIQAQVMLLLNSYHNGILAVQIFWGLWLFPFGYLVFKSGFLPKIFGVLLILGCFSYVVKFFSALLFPELVISGFVSKPGSFGEIGICLWLLIMGVKEKKPDTHNE
jgi:hypothetical protein